MKTKKKPEYLERLTVQLPEKLKRDFQIKMEEEHKNLSAVLRALIEAETYGKTS